MVFNAKGMHVHKYDVLLPLDTSFDILVSIFCRRDNGFPGGCGATFCHLRASKSVNQRF